MFYNLGELETTTNALFEWMGQRVGLSIHSRFKLDVREIDEDAEVVKEEDIDVRLEEKYALQSRFNGNPAFKSVTPHGVDPEARLMRRVKGIAEESMRGWCFKAWTVLLVLAKKRDPVSHRLFSECVDVDTLYTHFWTLCLAAVQREFEKEFQDGGTNVWVKQALISRFPQVRHVFKKELSVLAKKTKSVSVAKVGASPQEQEEMLQTLHKLLAAYLARSLEKMTRSVKSIFPNNTQVPTVAEVDDFNSQVVDQLRETEQDEVLAKAVSTGCCMALSTFASETEKLLNTNTAKSLYFDLSDEGNGMCLVL